MKIRIILLLMTLLCGVNVASGQQKVLAKFYVTHAILNGNDITEWAVKSKVFTVFYTDNKQFYMANYAEKDNTQSWGKIWGLHNQTKPETSSNYKTDIFYFNWDYKNSYDSKTGTCKAQLLKIYKPQGVVSVLKLITETLDVTEYTGYMEGTIDFSNL